MKQPFAKFAMKSQQNLQNNPANPARSESPDLHALLLEAGAAAPRRERARWDCPVCGKRARVSVDFSRGLFQCWTSGCIFHGSAHSLARQLGHKMNSPEWREKAANARHRRELHERVRSLRLERYRVLVEELRGKMRSYEELRGRVLQNIDLLEQSLSTYSELLALNAEMLLVEELPDLELCQFLAASERSRQTQIAEVVSRDGVFANGRFFDLPSASLQHSVAGVLAFPMSDEWTPRTSEG
jgi:ribosomal protein L37AE/L43A